MSTSVSRQNNPDRFEITVDGEVAGFAEFLDRGDRRIFVHTEIGEEFGGRGLAGTVVPVCPYVTKWLTRHSEHEDITSKPTPEDLTAVRG